MRVKSSHVKSYDEIQGNRDSFDQVPFMVHHPLKYKSLMSWFDTFHKKNIYYDLQNFHCFQITVDLHTPQYFGHTFRVLQDLQDGRRKSEHNLLL